jgi:L-ascorbate metabolism protein UlaG (beta-lactamase superfamily)
LINPIELKNPGNAFILLNYGSECLAIDPWIKSGIYDGGWSLFPDVDAKNISLDNVTHLFITHLHEDHCDPSALSALNKNVKAYIPRVFGSIVIERKLAVAGIKDVNYLDPGEPHQITENFVLEVIKPMNDFGQELDLYKKNSDISVAIDTGLMVTVKKFKLIFLADNTPYDYLGLGDTLNRMKEPDLLAFPYNGAASDYPICYTNILDQEMLAISDSRESKREKALLKFFEAIKPNFLMPYSSDFAVMGPAAKRFGKFSNSWWANKEMAADHYELLTGTRSVAIFSNDQMNLFTNSKGGKSVEILKGLRNKKTLKDVSDDLYTESCYVDQIYMRSNIDLEDLTKNAANHMFDFMKKLKIQSDWILEINLKDSDNRFFVDFKSRSLVSKCNGGKKILKLRIGSGYYEALLSGRTHWNNAQLSFQLEWQRTPNIYDHGIYKAINFFHVSKNRSA